MMTRRQILMAMVAGSAGFALGAKGAAAWYYEDMPPDVEAAFNAACKTRSDDHGGLIAASRSDLIARIAGGLLPQGASEQVACPICGCSFVVSADLKP